MKLNVLCKDNNNIEEDKQNNNELTIICNLCNGDNTDTTIKMILEDYGNEITEKNYPNCDILKNKL